METTNKIIKARIKTWEEMKQMAIRVDEGYGIIYLLDNAYTKIMEDGMPKDRIIELLATADFDGRYNTPDYEWVYTTDMIAEFIVEENKVIKISEFLKSKNCYKEFLENVDYYFIMKDRSDYTCEAQIISIPFIWKKTPQGQLFWQGIRKEILELDNVDNDLLWLLEGSEQEVEDRINQELEQFIENTQAEKALPEISENNDNENQDQISEQITPPLDGKKVIKANLVLVKDEMIRHVCHYLKFQLDFDEDVSIRFYYRFQDQQHLENNWVLVNHKTKQKGAVTKESAKMLIKSCCKIPAIEIIGRLNENGQYQKITTNKEGTIRTYEGKDRV